MCDSICNAALPMAPHLQKLYPVPAWGGRPVYDDKFQEIPNPERLEENPPPASFDVWIQGLHYLMRKVEKDGRELNTTDSHEKFLKSSNPKLLDYLCTSAMFGVRDFLKPTDGRSFESLYPRRRADIDLSDPTFKWLSSGFYSRLTGFMTLTYKVSLLHT